MAVPVDDVFCGSELLETHGTAGVKLLRADADLSTESEFEPISKTGRGIHINGCCIDPFQKFLGIDTQYVGFLEYDDSIWKSTRQQKPFLVHHAESRFATEIELFTENLLRGNEINLWEE